MPLAKSNEMDLTTGKILKKLLILTLPFIVTNVLQRLFQSVDIAILGIFVNDEAVAAVGVNASLISLFVDICVGFAVGANVVLSNSMGQNNMEKAHKTVGTAIWISIIASIIVGSVGVAMARTFLIWTNCDPTLLDSATTYLRIYLMGLPIILLYNFIAALLRAVGDTVRPMIYLLISGVANVGLNILFVVVFHKTVEGVAYATIISQGISCVLSLILLSKSKGYCRLRLKYFRIYKEEFIEIIKVGIPSAIQASLFSVSNILISSSVNSINKIATTGNAVAAQFSGIQYVVLDAISLATMTFVGQNYGAGNFRRVKKVLSYSIILQLIITSAVGWLIILLSRPLCFIMTDSEEVLHYAQIKLFILGSTYFMCGIMNTYSYCLRSIGKSTTSMIISIFFICGIRVVWLLGLFRLVPEFWFIFISYPVTWIAVILIDIPLFYKLLNKKQRDIEKTNAENNPAQNTETLSA